MAHFSIVEELVAAAVRKHPLPETIDGLDVQTKRRIIAEAERQGITPNGLLAVLRTQEEENMVRGEEAINIAALVRSRR